MPDRPLEVIIPESASGLRLDRALATVLAETIPELSRTRIKTLMGEGRVSQGGRAVNAPSRPVRAGEVFSVAIPQAVPSALPAQAMDLDVLYEDDQLIVVDKPAGLVVHPAPGNPDRTLVNALIAHCGASLAGVGGVGRPGIVHRLDKDTSGLMVVAKTDRAHQSLTQQFAARTIERVYVALVRGIAPNAGEISGAIGRSRSDRKKMAVVAGGRTALTRFRLIRVLAGGAASLIECRLATGRTHQIRVHLASIGHPLLGDPVYGGRRRGADPLAGALADFRRQALDAIVIGFEHPVTRAPLRFQKKYAPDFSALLERLEPLQGQAGNRRESM
ncbi:MAG: RluA family pseudouridine synthase [Alphaproteobacteria bacterium]|nr:RluA family pseudouridine synthase [Alphaproteobacteria bacterium]